MAIVAKHRRSDCPGKALGTKEFASHRHPDVAEMAVNVARRNVEASAKRHGEMREIAADAADSLLEGFKSRSGRSPSALQPRAKVAAKKVGSARQ
jgi:hypothetical protein